MSARRLVLLAVLLAACEHGAPFRPGDYGPDGGFGSSPPTRLTLSDRCASRDGKGRSTWTCGIS
jgi:hypothetical protein